MTAFDLKGHVSLVTGGNGGIGLGMARGLAEAGASIAIAARNMEKSEAAAATLRSLGADVITVAVDVSSEQSVKEMVSATLDKFGRIDSLIANAGVNDRKLPQDYSSETW
ncbi:MAG: SDR family NAD(P)-dependent oxidoreductase, partial [Alphaproteobacteria bacterium]|nr:SDR family NAD(P)-dependent oxidoreductase [Alphaproteobacteria bacterium]